MTSTHAMCLCACDSQVIVSYSVGSPSAEEAVEVGCFVARAAVEASTGWDRLDILLLERIIWPIVEPRIQEKQYAFRPGRRTLDQEEESETL